MTKNKTILSQNGSFRAKKKKIGKKFEFEAKTVAKMTKYKTILSQNWAKHRDNIKKNKSKIAQNLLFLFLAYFFGSLPNFV